MKKNFIFFFIFYFTIVSAWAETKKNHPIENNNYKTGIVKKESANIRVDSRISSEVITKLHQGEKITITKENFEWYKIILPSRVTGYVYKKYLQIDNNSKQGIIKANKLNIRNKPSLNGYLIGQIPQGTKVAIIKDLGEWAEIAKINQNDFNMYGWIHKNTVDLITDNKQTISSQKEANLNSKNTKTITLTLKKDNLKKIPSQPNHISLTGKLMAINNPDQCPANYKLKKGYLSFFLKINNNLADYAKKHEKQTVTVEGITEEETNCSYILVEKIN